MMRALALSLLVACGGAATPAIKTTQPAGTFGGAAWTMTKATVTKNGDKVSVKLFGEDVADCAFSATNTGYILFTMPAKTGKRPLKFSFDFDDPDVQTVTFVTPPSSNNISSDGLLDVTELTDTSVTFGIYAKAGKDEINGTVTATFCK